MIFLRYAIASILITAAAFQAQAFETLVKSDFVHAESKTGTSLVQLILSQSGESKFRREAAGQTLAFEIAGVHREFILREPIKTRELEVGPMAPKEVEQIVRQINAQ